MYAANYIVLDSTSSESVFEIWWTKKKSDAKDENIINNQEEVPDVLPCGNDNFGIVKDNILYYICGFIAKIYLKKLTV